MIFSVPLRLLLMWRIIYVVSEDTEWKCPTFDDSKISCLCDYPHTLRCSTDLIFFQNIADQLRKLSPEAQVSLLDCTVTNATYLPGPLLQGVSLHGLVLTSGELKNISKDAFFGLSSPLEALGLPNNHLEIVPTEALNVLYQLERLDLSGNNFSRLNDLSFKGLKSLCFLDLRNNQIDNVGTNTFEHLNNLTVIKLSGNRLKTSSLSALGKLNSLLELDLSMNALTGPLNSTTLPSMTSLKTLSLANNQFTSVCKNSLKGTPNLITLSLGHNQIDVLEDHAFKELPFLRVLNLDNNRIVSISSSSLSHLIQLTHLDLSHNFLQALTTDIITPLINLIVLRLDDNDISMVETEAFCQKTNLERLTLSDNPLNCDCNLVDFVVWFNNASRLSLTDRSTAVCMTPPSLENALLIEVPPEELRCQEDSYDIMMHEDMSAKHPGAQVVLRTFNFNGSIITLLWSLNMKEKSFSCDKLFVLEDMSADEVLLRHVPLKCNSSEMTDPSTLIVKLDLGSMQLFHRYRFCVVLLEENLFPDEIRHIEGCSEPFPLIVTNLSISKPTASIYPLKISSIHASLYSNSMKISIDIWNEDNFVDSKCHITVTIFLLSTLISKHILNCTDPKISLAGLPQGTYQVCASLGLSPIPENTLQCITVKDQVKSDVTVWLTVCFVLIITFVFLGFYLFFRRFLKRSRLTAHQCFPANNEFVDHHKQHSKYVKLQTTANI